MPNAILEQLKQTLLALGKALESFVAGKKDTDNESTTLPPKPPSPPLVDPNTRLYEAALACRGLDLSRIAPNERGCAEALSKVIQKIFPDFPTCVSTIKLKEQLDRSPHFLSTANPIAGSVSVFPTEGETIGHCGIWGRKGWVMSNTSYGENAGLWLANYTEYGWLSEAKRRGLQVYYYIAV